MTTIGTGAQAAALTILLNHAHTDGLLTTEALDVLTVGVSRDATPQDRRCAVKVLAEEWRDWAAEPDGACEVAMLLRHIAPGCDERLWQELRDETLAAADVHGDRMALEAARSNLEGCLDEAVGIVRHKVGAA